MNLYWAQMACEDEDGEVDYTWAYQDFSDIDEFAEYVMHLYNTNIPDTCSVGSHKVESGIHTYKLLEELLKKG